VTVRLTPWRGVVARAIVLAVIVALLPLPALAGDTVKPAKAQSLTASIEKIAARETLTRSKSDATQQTAKKAEPNTGSWSFFKSPVGIGIIAVLAAGTGYALYSKSNDRIQAPGR
jgi:hypothetical protein